jgi:hypothetical protein
VLLAQIKSVAAAAGRTTVNLVPRGLGAVEIEIMGERDAPTQVAVRVENPAVLQALREDRQMIAQSLGITDSSLLDFQEQAPRQETPEKTAAAPGPGTGTGPEGSPQERQQRAHTDTIRDHSLDILT